MPSSARPPRYPEINGVRTSFCSIQFDIASIPIVGVKEVNYEETDTITEIKGANGQLIGRTRGQASFSGSLVVYQTEWYHVILPQLVQAGVADGLLDGSFGVVAQTIHVAYAEESVPDDVVTDVLVGARIHSPKVTHSEGGDVLTVSLQMSLLGISWNGASALGSREAAAKFRASVGG